MAALVLWIATAIGGITMGAIWLSHDGPAAHRDGNSRISPGRLGAHAGLAASGLLLWGLSVAVDNVAPGWLALLLLAGAAALGFLMFMTWLAGRGAARAGDLPEHHISSKIVVLHGALAVLR